MPYRLRHIPDNLKFSQAFDLHVFASILPKQTIEEVLTACHAWQMRERALNMVCVLWWLIALSLYSQCSQAAVWRKISAGLRYIWPDAHLAPVTAAALWYRRKQLGWLPLSRLFRRICRPLASQESRGAFRFGLRLMALDGTLEDVATSAANTAYFGHRYTGKTASPFPQVRCVYLAECGTHAITDAYLAPCQPSETHGACCLLRSICAGMLVLLDRAFYSAPSFWHLKQRGAHALALLKSNVLTQAGERLPDGSVLLTVPLRLTAPKKQGKADKGKDKSGRLRGQRRKKRAKRATLRLRIISYTITDPSLPGEWRRPFGW